MVTPKDSNEYREEDRGEGPAYGLGYYGHLDPEPPLIPVYLTAISILAGVGVMVWLDWMWLTLILVLLVPAITGAYIFIRSRRRRPSSDPEWT